jgi:hypothetical protein
LRKYTFDKNPHFIYNNGITLILRKKSMATYNEILQQVQSLRISDQLQLLADLQKIVSQEVEEAKRPDEVNQGISSPQLQGLIQHTIKECLDEYFGDPDRGLELKPEFRESLLEIQKHRSSGRRRILATDAYQKLGVN